MAPCCQWYVLFLFIKRQASTATPRIFYLLPVTTTTTAPSDKSFLFYIHYFYVRKTSEGINIAMIPVFFIQRYFSVQYSKQTYNSKSSLLLFLPLLRRLRLLKSESLLLLVPVRSTPITIVKISSKILLANCCLPTLPPHPCQLPLFLVKSLCPTCLCQTTLSVSCRLQSHFLVLSFFPHKVTGGVGLHAH